MLTQRGRLLDDVEDVKKKMGPLRIPRMLLKKVVGDAQNGPPDGAADGTVDPMLWTLARDLSKALEDVDFFLAAIERTEREAPGKRTTDG